MLDQIMNEFVGHEFISNMYNEEFSHIDYPMSPEPFQPFQRACTVKEMLKKKRSEKWTSEHPLKSPRYECLPDESKPHAMAPVPSESPNTPTYYPSTPPEPLPITQPQVQWPVQQPSPPGDAVMSLFQWQIQQEAQKVEGLSVEQLRMQDSDGDTFLHIAVAQGRRALVYVLAAKMAPFGLLDVKEHNGQTPLHLAAVSNQHLILRDLLTHGAQINTRDLWGRSPLHVCALKGHLQSLKSISKAVEESDQTLDIGMFNYDGLTPLHVAVLSHGAVVREMRRLENPCPFMMSELTRRKHVYLECIKALMLMGASYGTKDLKSGRTCLHMAAEEANVELFHLFLNQPRSVSLVNAKTFSGNTALHIASSLQNFKHQEEAVELLMRSGADPGARNFENELPSQLAPEGSPGEKVRLILKGRCVNM